MCVACNSKKVCSGGKVKLTEQYNRLTTLYNVSRDIELKKDYLQMRREILELSHKKECPTELEISIVTQYVNNEYTKYKNIK